MPLRLWMTLILLLMLSCFVDRSDAGVFNHASGESYWLVVGREHDPARRADGSSEDPSLAGPWGEVRARNLDGTGPGRWEGVTELSREVVNVGAMGERLAIVFADGTWALASRVDRANRATRGSLAPGPTVPGEGRALAVAEANDDVRWVLARDASGLVLHGMRVGRFEIVRRLDLPTSDTDRLRLANAGPGRMLVARWTIDGRVEAWIERIDEPEPTATNEANVEPTKAWSVLATGGVREAVALPGLSQPTLLLVGEDGLSLRSWVKDRWTEGRRVNADAVFSQPETTGFWATTAGGEIRIVARAGGAIVEQGIASDGSAATQALRAGTMPVAGENGVWLVRAVVTLSVLPVLVWSMLQSSGEPAPLRVRIAPLGRRLLAGILDAWPLTLGLLLVSARHADGQTDGTPTFADSLTMALSIVAYMIYTTCCELLTGRSPGKWMFGLRVVRPDGRRPEPMRIVARNLFRGLDTLLFPLLIVLLTPWRQRMGDYLANTIVTDSEPDHRSNTTDGSNRSNPDHRS